MLNHYIVMSLLMFSLGIEAYNTQLRLLTHIASNNSCAKGELKQAVNQNLADIIYGKSCHINPKLLASLLDKQQDMLSSDQALLDLWQTHNKNLVDAKFRCIERAYQGVFVVSCVWQSYKTYKRTKPIITVLDQVCVLFWHAALTCVVMGIVIAVKDLKRYSQADVTLLQNKIAHTQQLCKQLEQLIEKQATIQNKI